MADAWRTALVTWQGLNMPEIIRPGVTYVGDHKHVLWHLWDFFAAYTDPVSGAVSSAFDVIDASSPANFAAGAVAVQDTDWFVIRSKGTGEGTPPWEAQFYVANPTTGRLGIRWYPGDGSGGWTGAGFGGAYSTLPQALQQAGMGGSLHIWCDPSRFVFRVLHNQGGTLSWSEFVYLGGLIPKYPHTTDLYPAVAIVGQPDRGSLALNGSAQRHPDGTVNAGVSLQVPTGAFVEDDSQSELFGSRDLIDVLVGSNLVGKRFPARGSLVGVYVGYVGAKGEMLDLETEADALVGIYRTSKDTGIFLPWRSGLSF